MQLELVEFDIDLYLFKSVTTINNYSIDIECILSTNAC